MAKFLQRPKKSKKVKVKIKTLLQR